jgi:hypothetical protein
MSTRLEMFHYHTGIYIYYYYYCSVGGSHGRDRMVVGYTTTHMQSVPFITKVFNATFYVIKFYQSLEVSAVSSTNKTDHYNITEILLKVVLYTITLILSAVS